LKKPTGNGKNDSISVYNPTSIIKHFLSRFAFKPFWSETGTPSYLVDYVKSQPERLFSWENKRISEEAFSPLYYEGYLTRIGRVYGNKIGCS